MKIPFSRVLLIALISLFLVSLLLLRTSTNLPLQSPDVFNAGSSSSNRTGILEKKCDVYSGQWVPYDGGPYYTNETCNLMNNETNCMKLGRPDTEFLKWRWKPNDCDLHLFDPFHFLELVRGKSMAFVGDSVVRNQMQSLVCLLAKVAYPVDITYKYTQQQDTKWRHYFYLYVDYNFTLTTSWSPFLVKFATSEDNPNVNASSYIKLHIDQPDESWTTRIHEYNYVIVSAGHWFFRPSIYYKNNNPIGCYECHGEDNITSLGIYYGYKMVWQTIFNLLKSFEGVTILRTFSPAHFENGGWNEGQNCKRTMPFSRNEMKFDYRHIMHFSSIQMEEMRKAYGEERWRLREKFVLMNVTEIMLMRPDGHPNYYAKGNKRNSSVADCTHWCLPGPIDTWNEFLFYALKQKH